MLKTVPPRRRIIKPKMVVAWRLENPCERAYSKLVEEVVICKTDVTYYS